MRKWLREHAFNAFLDADYLYNAKKQTSIIWDMYVLGSGSIPEALDKFMGDISWPPHKPPASFSIDDRCMMFKGTWPTQDEMLTFTPWNKV